MQSVLSTSGFENDAKAAGLSEQEIETIVAWLDVPVFLLALIDKGERANLWKAERNLLAIELASLASDYRAGVHAKVATLKRRR